MERNKETLNMDEDLIILVDEDQNDNNIVKDDVASLMVDDYDDVHSEKKSNFFGTKAGKVVLGIGLGVGLGLGVYAISKTPTFQKMVAPISYDYDRVDAMPRIPYDAKAGSYLTYIKDDKGKDKLVCATENHCIEHLAPEYVSLEGYTIVRDSKDLKCYYEKNGAKFEALPIVEEGYDLVWLEDYGYMLERDIVTTVYSNPTYVVPNGYSLMVDKNGNYYGVKVKTNTKQEEKGKTIGQKTNY